MDIMDGLWDLKTVGRRAGDSNEWILGGYGGL
jgi:hypothetical protein